MTTVREWLLSSSLDSIDKSFMLEQVCGMNKAAQLIHGDRVLTPEEENRLNDIANKRSEGVPLPTSRYSGILRTPFSCQSVGADSAA